MKNSTSSIKKSKLASYTAVAGAVVAGAAANAQTTYMDVNPDVVVDSLNPYSIDFNGDQQPDLGLGVQHQQGSFTNGGASYTYKGAFAYAFPFAGQIVTTVDTLTNVAALNCGVAVSSASVFGTGTYGNLGFAAIINPGAIPFNSNSQTPGTTPFLGATDKNLGVKFTVGSNSYYGWVKLSVAADATTITVKEYGYQATAGGAVETCDQAVGLNEININDKVTIKNTLTEAQINVTSDLIGGTVSIVSISGQVIKTVKISSVDTTISFDGISSGIYMINAKFAGGAVNKKVYIK